MENSNTCYYIEKGKRPSVFVLTRGGDVLWESEINYYPQGHINQVYHWIDSILQNKTPRYGCEQGIHAVQCTLAVIHSAQTGVPVRLDEISAEYTAY
jgi:predicted dehydrogenase